MNETFGQAELKIQDRIAGSVALHRVSAVPALGPTLRFDFGLRMLDLRAREDWSGNQPDIRAYELEDLRGEVAVLNGSLLVGSLAWVGSRSNIRSADYEHESQISLTTTLDYARVERLEDIRKGGTLELTFRMWPKVLHEGAVIPSSIADLRANIPREQWGDVLRAVRGEEIAVLEIKYNSAYADRFRAAVGELKSARLYVDAGDYATAIVRCRKAMEIVAAATRLEEPSASGVVDVLSPWVGDQRSKIYADALRCIKDLGNIELHEIVEHGYGRTEALFAVGSAELLVQLYGALLTERRSRPSSSGMS